MIVDKPTIVLVYRTHDGMDMKLGAVTSEEDVGKTLAWFVTLNEHFDPDRIFARVIVDCASFEKAQEFLNRPSSSGGWDGFESFNWNRDQGY